MTSNAMQGLGINVLSESDKEYIRQYVAEGRDKEEQKKRREECADVFGVKIESIRSLTAWTVIKKNKNIGDIKSVTDNIPGKIDKIINHSKNKISHENNANSISEIDENNPSGEGMGALINYNNVVKNARRQKLKEFIDNNTDVEKRKYMKVLCLPGVECLEIPVYLELGFLPENIIGVEAGVVKKKSDSQLLEKFKVNASQYGIQYRLGELEKILESENTVFNVVSLDFLGPICGKYINILRKINVGNNSLIVTNFMGKRESLEIQNTINLSSSYIKPRTTLEKVFTAEDMYSKKYENSGKIDSAEVSINDTRNSGIIMTVLGNIGIDKVHNFMYNDILKEIGVIHGDIENITKTMELIELISLPIFDNLRKVFELYVKKEVIDDFILNIQGMLLRGIMKANLLRGYKSYKYKSSQRQGGPIMFSDFIKLEKPNNMYFEVRNSIKFLLLITKDILTNCNILENTIEIKKGKRIGTIQIHDGKTGKLKNLKDNKNPNDYIIYTVNGKELCKIQIKKLLNDALFYDKTRNGDLIDNNYFNGLEINREEIIVDANG